MQATLDAWDRFRAVPDYEAYGAVAESTEYEETIVALSAGAEAAWAEWGAIDGFRDDE